MKKKEKMRVWLSKCSTVSVVLPVSLSLLLSCSLALAFRFSAVKDSVNLFCCWLVFFFSPPSLPPLAFAVFLSLSRSPVSRSC